MKNGAFVKRVLLINPSRRIAGKEDNLYARESLVPSLGLASIGAYCIDNGIEPRIIDLRLRGYSMADVLEYIENMKPEFVGIGAFTAEIAYAHETAKAVKAVYPGLPVVAGGPHPSLMPEGTLHEFPEFDIVVIGEGEKTIVKLAEMSGGGSFAGLENIPGIAYRAGGKLIINPVRECIENLDSLPVPAWHLFDLKLYNGIFPVSASRGCPYRCYFCTPLYLGGKVRVRGHKSIISEMRHLADRYHASRIQFSDAMMGMGKDNLLALCRGFRESEVNEKVKWDCETRADAVEPGLLSEMKKAGCEWVALGVESGNEKILKEVVKKGETKAQIRDAVNAIKQAGLKARCFFILGHCTETGQTINDTIKFALELKPDAISFGLMVPNPGSEIRALAETGVCGLRILHSRWDDYQQFGYSCMESEALPLSELKKWQAKAYFTYYLHNPLKALEMLFSRSSYNYTVGGILKNVKMLLANRVRKK